MRRYPWDGARRSDFQSLQLKLGLAIMIYAVLVHAGVSSPLTLMIIGTILAVDAVQ